MRVDNQMMLWSITERLTQQNYIQINTSQNDFSRRLFTFDLKNKWSIGLISYFIKPHKDFTTCIMLIDSTKAFDFGSNEDELYVFQNYVREELGDLYDNLKLITVVISDYPYKHLKANDNTIVIKDGKICRRMFFERDLKPDLKALSSCYNYARAKTLNTELFDSFYGGYSVLGTYLICFLLVMCWWNMEEWNLRPLSVHGLFYQKDLFSLITYQFMHAGFSHLFGNVIMLFIVGRSLESKVGLTKFLSIFLGSGILGGLIATAYRYDTLNSIGTVGCSGAVFGCIGAWIVVSCYDFRTHDFNIVNFVIDTSVACGYIYLCSKNADVDNAVHIAGFACGMGVIVFVEFLEQIGKDEVLYLSEDYINTKDEEYRYFNLNSFEKSKELELQKEKEEAINAHKKHVFKNTESEWVRF